MHQSKHTSVVGAFIILGCLTTGAYAQSIGTNDDGRQEQKSADVEGRVKKIEKQLKSVEKVSNSVKVKTSYYNSDTYKSKIKYGKGDKPKKTRFDTKSPNHQLAATPGVIDFAQANCGGLYFLSDPGVSGVATVHLMVSSTISYKDMTNQIQMNVSTLRAGKKLTPQGWGGSLNGCEGHQWLSEDIGENGEVIGNRYCSPDMEQGDRILIAFNTGGDCTTDVIQNLNISLNFTTINMTDLVSAD